jgi:hypothetical protein
VAQQAHIRIGGEVGGKRERRIGAVVDDDDLHAVDVLGTGAAQSPLAKRLTLEHRNDDRNPHYQSTPPGLLNSELSRPRPSQHLAANVPLVCRKDTA